MKIRKRSASIPVISLLCLLLTGTCVPVTSEQSLQSELENVLHGFNGQAGVYVVSPGMKLETGVNADTLFPTASMIKVPILCTLWDLVGAGRLNPDSLVYFDPDSLHYPWKGEDALGRFVPGSDISVRQLMTHMITFSDNHASLYLQALAGGGTAINEWLQHHDFSNTRVNSRTAGRDTAYAHYGWGQTTPREMTRLLLMIRGGEIASPAISEIIYRHLTRIYWNGEALSQLPPTVQAASKQGAVDESRSEVVLVNAPHGDYAFCVITKNQQDTSWVKSNEGVVLIRKISALLWKYFEPDLHYKLPDEVEQYFP